MVQAGEVITLESWVNAEWMMGATGKGRGMFPVNFVEIVEPLPTQLTASASHFCLSHQAEDGSFSSCSLFSVVST